MSSFFTTVSWSAFIQYAGLVLFTYYCFMAWHYRKDLLSWWKDRMNK